MRAGTPPEEEAPGMLDDARRAAGLAVRAVGPMAAGAAGGAALGAPLGGVGAGPGALAGMTAMGVLQLVDKLGGTDYVNKALDYLKVPRPESSTEKLAVAGMEGLAGAGGMVGAMKTAAAGLPRAAPFVKPVVEGMEAAPATAAAATLGGATAQEVVAQEGGDAGDQFLANVAGSVVAPAAGNAMMGVGRAVGRKLGDVGHAIGAAAGSEKSATRLAADAVESLVKNDRGDVEGALRSATTHIPGASPTVAEALAERNMQLPGRQIGGELIKLQDNISGHKGVADILPSKMKANQAAMEEYLKELNARTSILREDAFRNARSSPAGPALQRPGTPIPGADPAYVRNVIAYALQDREIAGHSLARRVLQTVASDLKAVPKNASGKVDPEVMQGVRQSAGAAMKRMLAEEPTANQAVAAKALDRVQKAIDDAIERGGAVGWKRYMREHAAGMKPVDAHIKRLAEANKILQGIQGTSPEKLVADTLPMLPTLLHRPTMLMNYALHLIGIEATEPVTRQLAARLADPKGFAELMAMRPGTPARMKADALLLQASVLSNLIQSMEGKREEK